MAKSRAALSAPVCPPETILTIIKQLHSFYYLPSYFSVEDYFTFHEFNKDFEVDNNIDRTWLY
jgi:hypothetical protein